LVTPLLLGVIGDPSVTHFPVQDQKGDDGLILGDRPNEFGDRARLAESSELREDLGVSMPGKAREADAYVAVRANLHQQAELPIRAV
jgi:hypothetical protein